MSDKLIGELLEMLIRLVADRLIAYFKLEYVIELVSMIFFLAMLVIGAVAYLQGWP